MPLQGEQNRWCFTIWWRRATIDSQGREWQRLYFLLKGQKIIFQVVVWHRKQGTEEANLGAVWTGSPDRGAGICRHQQVGRGLTCLRKKKRAREFRLCWWEIQPLTFLIDVSKFISLDSKSWFLPHKIYFGLPWLLSGKESACQCRRCGFGLCVGKIPWRGKWQPTPVFLPGKSQGQRILVVCSP